MRTLAAAGQVLLTDGALGTEYQRLGLPVGACADLLSIDEPDKVFQVTRSYVDAGSDIVLTTTFRANSIALEGYGRAADVAAINEAGARIAREAAGDKLVLGDVGPSGKMPGEASDAELERAFCEQCEALVAGGVDGIVLETFSDLAEAAVALAAGRRTGLPVIVSFAFDTGRAKDRTMMGVTPEHAAAAMTDGGAYAVGANCGTGFEGYVEICRRFRAATHLPVWIKPNGGLPELVDGRVVYRTSPEEFASYVPKYIEGGATFIGGCCGTNPDFIRAAAAVLVRV